MKPRKSPVKKSKLKKKCQKALSNKIRINMREFNKGTVLSNGRKFSNRGQVIAVSYSQLRKARPSCFE